MIYTRAQYQQIQSRSKKLMFHIYSILIGCLNIVRNNSKLVFLLKLFINIFLWDIVIGFYILVFIDIIITTLITFSSHSRLVIIIDFITIRHLLILIRR